MCDEVLVGVVVELNVNVELLFTLPHSAGEPVVAAAAVLVVVGGKMYPKRVED